MAKRKSKPVKTKAVSKAKTEVVKKDEKQKRYVRNDRVDEMKIKGWKVINEKHIDKKVQDNLDINQDMTLMER